MTGRGGPVLRRLTESDEKAETNREVLTKIVNPQEFPDYAIPKKRTGRKKRS